MALTNYLRTSYEQIGILSKRLALTQSFRSCPNSTKANGKVLPKVVLFSKPSGCSLCVVAKKALAPYVNRLELTEVDITLPENRLWYEKYQYEIPVVQFDGHYLMKHRVDTKLFEAVLIQWEKDQENSKPQ